MFRRCIPGADDRRKELVFGYLHVDKSSCVVDYRLLWKNPVAMRALHQLLSEHAMGLGKIDVIVGVTIESSVIVSAIALEMGCLFIPVRAPVGQICDTRTDFVGIKGKRVLMISDVVITGDRVYVVRKGVWALYTV